MLIPVYIWNATSWIFTIHLIIAWRTGRFIITAQWVRPVTSARHQFIWQIVLQIEYKTWHHI